MWAAVSSPPVGDNAQLRILRSGSDAWNEWRRNNERVPVDLSHSSLRRVQLRGALLANSFLAGSDLTNGDLSAADLSGSNLSECKLVGTHFDGATLSWANLTGVLAGLLPSPASRRRHSRTAVMPSQIVDEQWSRATTFDGAMMRYCRLQEGIFRGVSFRGAKLLGAFLESATFDGAHFEGADLDSAEIGKTTFRRTNIQGALNLANTFHSGPSEIDFETLRNACGQLPSRFLRGIGFSEAEIGFARLYDQDLADDEAISILYHMADMRGHTPIQKRMIFISYAHADAAFVDLLESSLAAKGFRCWRDVHDFVSGRIEKQIDRAITLNEIVVIVLSASSIRSDWVEWEVSRARAREKQVGHDILCPIALDDTWKNSDWPGPLSQQIRDYHILDFSNWQSAEEFDTQMQRLDHGLRTFYRAVQ